MFLLGGAHLRWVWVDMRWVGLDFSCQDDKQRHCTNKCKQGPAMHTYFLDCLLVCLFVFVCDVLVFPKEEEGGEERKRGEEERRKERRTTPCLSCSALPRLTFAWQVCRTGRTDLELALELVGRNVELVQLVEYEKIKIIKSFSFDKFYEFYIPANRF